MTEGLDHLLPGEHLLDKAVHRSHVALLATEIGCRAASQPLGGEHHHSRQGNGEQCELPVEDYHARERGNDGDERTEHIGQTASHHLAQGVDIVGVHTHHVAMRVLVEELDRERLHVLKEALTQLEQHSLTHVYHQAAVEVGAQGAHLQHSSELEQRDGQWCKVWNRLTAR